MDVGMKTIGTLKGTAVIRDAQGNVKGTFEFGGPATLDQAEAVAEATGAKLDTQPQASQE